MSKEKEERVELKEEELQIASGGDGSNCKNVAGGLCMALGSERNKPECRTCPHNNF